MFENDQFYSLGKTPADIIGTIEGAGGFSASYLKHYSWNSIRHEAVKNGLKAYFIDLYPIGRVFDYTAKQIPMVEIPEVFLTMPDYIHTFLTSVNFTEAGPFHSSELAFRAHLRLFTWDMYVYCLPHSQWLPARDVPLLRVILEKHFPLRAGDTGPAGGLIIQRSGERQIEVSPVDAACCSWLDAEQACHHFSHNGIGGWRLPSPAELGTYAHTLRTRLRKSQNVYQTSETTLHWSSSRRNGSAVAVVTQENEDSYLPFYYYPMGGSSGGYYQSTKGPWRGNEKEFPVTDWLPVRAVRDLQ